jgi:Flp pilus assembly protein TadG
MVEFAISIPFLFFFLVSILFFGRYFLVSQVMLHAAQEGAKMASRTPNLNNDTTREQVRGFTVGGAGSNANSIIYASLGAANLLSNGTAGNLPPGSKVEILPFDSASDSANLPAGTVAVLITYPFQLLGNTFAGPSASVAIQFHPTGNGAPFRFLNFTISQEAVAAQEIYQAIN